MLPPARNRLLSGLLSLLVLLPLYMIVQWMLAPQDSSSDHGASSRKAPLSQPSTLPETTSSQEVQPARLPSLAELQDQLSQREHERKEAEQRAATKMRSLVDQLAKPDADRQRIGKELIDLGQAEPATSVGTQAAALGQLLAGRPVKAQPPGQLGLVAMLGLEEAGAPRITAASFSPDGQALVVGRDNGKLQVYDLRTPQPRLQQTVVDHPSRITNLVFDQKGLRLASAAVDGLRIWEVTAGKLTLKHLLPTQPVLCKAMAFVGDEARFSTCVLKVSFKEQPALARDMYVQLWDLRQEKPEPKETLLAKNMARWPYSLAYYTRDGKSLATHGFKNKHARRTLEDADVWDLTGAAPVLLSYRRTGELAALALSADSGWLALSLQSTTNVLLRPSQAPHDETSEEPRLVFGHGLTNVRFIAFRNDGKALLCGSDQGELVWCDLQLSEVYQKASLDEAAQLRARAYKHWLFPTQVQRLTVADDGGQVGLLHPEGLLFLLRR